MTAVDDLVIDSASGGRTECWITIILVFFVLFTRVSVLLRVWTKRRRTRRDLKAAEGAVGDDAV